MKYKSFKEEARLCLQRFKRAGTKIGDLVLFFHHGISIEPLPEPPKTRLDFYPIGKEHETKRQWAIRAHWLRPIPKPMYGELPKELVAAGEKCNVAWEKYHAACVKAGVACVEAAYNKYLVTQEKYYVAYEKYAPQINALIKKYFPDCPWDGHSIIDEYY